VRNIVRDILGPSGPIARHIGAGFESRLEQIEMSRRVNLAMASKHKVMIEAGTGIGKSFAYLVPALVRIATTGQRVVVATHTINLQEQLLGKDIPLLLETLGQWGLSGPGDGGGGDGSSSGGSESSGLIEVNPVLVKGRGNYISLRRLKLASRKQNQLFREAAEKRSLHVIEDWAMRTQDGSVSDLPAIERWGVWDRVQSDTDNCMGRKCPTYEACFYQQSRRAIEQGNLLVCNHAVFFADLKLRDLGAGFLPEYDHVIFDEAHNLEDVASDHFGLSLTEGRVEHYLRQLYGREDGKGFLSHLGSVSQGKQSEATGLDLDSLIDLAVANVHQTQDVSRAFFQEWLDLSRGGKLRNGRIPEPEMVQSPLASSLRSLGARLRALKESIPGEEDRYELNAYAVRAEAIAFDADALNKHTMPGCIYWLEGAEESSDRRGGGVRLRLACSPVDVAPVLREKLFGLPISITLTSATLATSVQATPASKPASKPAPSSPVQRRVVRDVAELEDVREAEVADVSIDAPPSTAATATSDPFYLMRSRLGLEDASTLQLGSPFDYAKQVKVIVDLHVPDLRRGGVKGKAGTSHAPGFLTQQAHTQLLSERLAHHIEATDGGAFVLFTSLALMRQVAEYLEGPCAAARRPLLVQGRDGPPGKLVEQFRGGDRSVLLGAASIWQGVDVKGRALRNVIITKLPFDPPDRPLVEARCERIASRGGDPFMEESLPRALLKFRQGFGRLIRSHTDTGQVVILDGRVVTTGYGKLFLQAIPPGVEVVIDRPRISPTGATREP
jgi:ATP-dependent DNA helicase DinG